MSHMCFLWNTKLDAGFDPIDNGYAHLGNIPSAASCQEACHRNTQCQYFVWDQVENECFLKKRNWRKVTSKFVEKYVSGPKECGKTPLSGIFSDIIISFGRVDPFLKIILSGI